MPLPISIYLICVSSIMSLEIIIMEFEAIQKQQKDFYD